LDPLFREKSLMAQKTDENPGFIAEIAVFCAIIVLLTPP
jgi:hypothetical protein